MKIQSFIFASIVTIFSLQGELRVRASSTASISVTSQTNPEISSLPSEQTSVDELADTLRNSYDGLLDYVRIFDDAIQKGQIQIVKVLLDKVGNELDLYKARKFADTLKYDDMETLIIDKITSLRSPALNVKILGADPHWTPFMMAAFEGKLMAFEEHIGSIKEKDSTGRSVLMIASMSGKCQIIQRIIDYISKESSESHRNWIMDVDATGENSLMKAADKNQTQAVEILLDYLTAEDVNAQNSKGETALMMAFKWGITQSVESLLNKGSDIDAEDLDGSTALIKAIEKSDLPTIQRIIPLTRDLRRQELMIAAKTGNTEIVSELLNSDSTKKSTRY